MPYKHLTAALLVALGVTVTSSAFAASELAVHAGRLGKATSATMASTLNLGSGASFQSDSTRVNTQRGTVKTRARQLYNGVPVYGRSVVVERDASGNVLSMEGTAERGVVADLATVSPRLSAAQAQAALKAAHPLSSSHVPFNAKSDLFVYPAKDGNKARLVYRTSYVVDNGRGMSRPTALIDANTGKIIKQWEGLTDGRLPPPSQQLPVLVQATGIGGNEGTGSYFYDGQGAGHELLDVQRTGMTCYMQNEHVATYNVAGGQRATLWSFGCPSAPYVSGGDAINGAFSAINDAHHFGGVVHDMYTSWFNEPPLKNDDGSAMQLHMWVHYGTNYANAFWDGSEMVFGDNNGGRYPFVVLDVTGHEISHGFTEQHAGLEYHGQSGGMNEAFSDMAGEAVKFFDRGSNDFLVGEDMINPSTVESGALPALRDMCTPSRDGHSIDTADEYTDALDVHYTSGVYNHAFCLLAKTKGWDTRKAFEVFHDANATGWKPDETFNGGACSVEQAATDRGYSAADVTAAFAAVKVACDKAS